MAKKENIKPKKEEKNKRHFWKDFKAELKRVVWPTPKQLVNNTTAVITIVIVVGIIVFGLDLVFETINSKGINALQVKLQETYSNSTTDNTTSVEETDDASGVNGEVVTEVETTEETAE